MSHATLFIQIAPGGPPLNVRAYILNATSIKVNWTVSSQASGYVIVYIDSTGNRNVLSTKETESVIRELIINCTTISCYLIMEDTITTFAPPIK